jgi:hypothetical protein
MSSMYPHSLSYHANKFSEKIRHMNDTNSQSITLRADEARNLHTDIFALLARIAALTEDKVEVQPTTIDMSGGKF